MTSRPVCPLLLLVAATVVGAGEAFAESPAGSAGTARLKFRAASFASAMIDESERAKEQPMELVAVMAHQPVVPVLVRKPVNPALGIELVTKGALQPLVLEAVTLSLAGTTKPADVAELALLAGGPAAADEFTARFAAAAKPSGEAPADDTHLGVLYEGLAEL
jgi:hypothetical protein